jgi:hypothetical protein
VITSEDLDQRRLARSVLAQQAVNLAYGDPKGYSFERSYTSEGLGDVTELQS